MATPSIVGVRRGDHWHGTFVGYDGGLELLGTKLLDLVLELGGDLDAVWSRITSAPDGWRHAFSEPYERGFNVEYFETGRTEPPLLTDEDRFVRLNAVYWYIFDLEARALNIYGIPEQGSDWPLVERILFSTDGRAQFQGSTEGHLLRKTGDGPHSMFVRDWVAAMDAAYPDVPYEDRRPDLTEATARVLDGLLAAELPIVGRRMALAVNVDMSTTLSPDGFICPFTLFVSSGPDPAVPTDIFDHPSFVLFPRRTMNDMARCEAALRSALGRIAIEIGLAKVPLPAFDRSEAFFRAIFPFHILDRKLDAAAQDAAVKAEIKKAFTTVK